MQGGTVFHFITEGIEAALDQARAAAQGKDVRVGGGSGHHPPVSAGRATPPPALSDEMIRRMSIRFGLYPGGAAGDDTGRVVIGPPDNPDGIRKALEALERGAAPLIVRAYAVFTDESGSASAVIRSPRDADQLAHRGRSLDLVVQYQSRAGDVDGYAQFVRNAVRRYGAFTATLQIAEEPNVAGNAALDGDYPDVLQAIVSGVAAANDEARARGFEHLQVGVNSTPLFGPASGFYPTLLEAGGRALVDGLAYVGLDMFPDVFRPVPRGDVRAATRNLLTYHRREILVPAGLGHLPLHITEHGWPTGEGRTPDRQAEILRDVIESVLDVHEELGVEVYELFSLRDAASDLPGLFHRFGIMTDDYTPKPAFDVFRDLLVRAQQDFSPR
jgi:hypothetical protein